jgi:transcriptional regulator with XRE-family HTH domain
MAEANRKRLGRRVKALRKAKGWTQEELASRSNLHPTYIGGIERGERNVGFDNLLKIANALREHPSALFDDFPR